MLIAALVTTLRYDFSDSWTGGLVKPWNQAICYLQPPTITDGIGKLYSYQRTLVSIVLLAAGMINRVARLYVASYHFIVRLRSKCSSKVRSFLDICYGGGSSKAFIACTASVVVYRPLLAFFLTVRLFLDILTSKAFEVWWLMLAFLLGTLKLWMPANRLDEPGSQQWSFGQVLAVVNLVVPVIALSEGWQTSHATASSRSVNPQHIASYHALQQVPFSQVEDVHGSQTARPSPHENFYAERWAFPPLICICCTTIFGFLVLITVLPMTPSSLIMAIANVNSPFFALLDMYLFVLLSVTLPKRRPSSPRKKTALQFLCFCVCGTVVVLTLGSAYGLMYGGVGPWSGAQEYGSWRRGK
ncbi:hypothetical protein EK21DRAFT_92864 [Setomelanomma holmii]|uniref:Uncharacterized protein n=1 Tax=Setomelanomma holmii TaxID=210430 RepID=A0A9P4H214_9PLEO|nr:hypothetical protein EK21DRAFT_92864 [Setomelanomma holmii]